MGSSTENSAFGPTRNPHDTSRVPGGSSGGSAAAVAAGFAPLALGSDTGGSIRQPAALCGVVGVKPTYGAVSRYGLIAFASSLDQIGPFANTVADAALVLEVISGHDPMDSTSIRPATGDGALDLTGQLDRGVAGLRVGRITDLPAGASPDVAERLEQAFDALRAAGAEIVDVAGPGLRLRPHGLLPDRAGRGVEQPRPLRRGAVRAPGRGARHERDVHGHPHRRVRRRGEAADHARHVCAVGRLLRRVLRRALKVRRLIADDFAAAYEQVDVLLTPTSPTVAFPIGDKTADPMSMYLCDTYTIPSNLSGEPAMSVPFGTGEAGLPVGVQVLAPALKEDVMFRVAAELERAAHRVGGSSGTS